MSDEQEYKPVAVTVIQPNWNEPAAAPAPAESPYNAPEPVAPMEAYVPQPPEHPAASDETFAPSVGGGRRRSKRPVIIVILIILAGLGFAASTIFGGKKVEEVTAPVAVAPSSEAPVVPAAKAACEQMLRDNATKSGADADAYVAQNQAWVQQCVQQKSGSQ